MNRKIEWKYLFLIIVVFIAACIETDIYLPAFPDMMTWFSASESSIQGLLTWNFVGICVSGPLYGPLSDSFGRKKPLMIALGMFLVGSLIALFAQSLDQMLIGRVLQGFGSGGCFTLGTAIIFDTFQKERSIAALSTLNTIVPLIMAAAPMIGGYLNYSFGFRSNFLVIAIFVLLSFIVSLFFLKETLIPEKRAPFDVRKILGDFKQALSHRGLWELNLVMSFIFGGYISFLSETSILFVVEFGMSKALFPLIQAAILGGWVAGSLLLNRVVTKWEIPKIKKAGILLCAIGGLELAAAVLILPRDPYSITFGMVLYALGANWIIGLYFPEGMEILPNIKGITASLLTSVRLLVAALVVTGASSLYNGTIYPLAAIVFGTIIFMIPTLRAYEKRQAKTSTNIN